MIASVSRKKHMRPDARIAAILVFFTFLYTLCALLSKIPARPELTILSLYGRDVTLGAMLTLAVGLVFRHEEKAAACGFAAVILFESLICFYFHFLSPVGLLSLSSLLAEILGNVTAALLYRIMRRRS